MYCHIAVHSGRVIILYAWEASIIGWEEVPWIQLFKLHPDHQWSLPEEPPIPVDIIMYNWQEMWKSNPWRQHFVAIAIVLSGNNFQKAKFSQDFETSCDLTDDFSHVSEALHLSWDRKIFFKTQVQIVVMCVCQCTCSCKCFVPMV